MSWLALALGYAAVTCFALAMTGHHRTVFGRVASKNRARMFRLVGSILTAGALAAVVAAFGWPIGIVAWVASLSISGFVLTQLLAYAPRLVFAPVAPLLLSALLVSVISQRDIDATILFR